MRSFFVQVSRDGRSVVVLAVDAGGRAEDACGFAIDHPRKSSAVNFRCAPLRSDHQSQTAATMSSAKAIGPCGLACAVLSCQPKASSTSSGGHGALRASAAPTQRTMSGEWSGKYVCGQGVTGVQMIFSEDGSRALFHSYALPEIRGCRRAASP